MLYLSCVIMPGESRAMSIDSKQSHVVLSNLSAGSSYVIAVFSTQGRAQSDALTSTITTGTQLVKLSVSYSYTFDALTCKNKNKPTTTIVGSACGPNTSSSRQCDRYQSCAAMDSQFRESRPLYHQL